MVGRRPAARDRAAAAGEDGRAFPALVDRGDHVDVKMLESRAAQDAAMRTGTRRLLLLTIPSPARHVIGQLGNRAQLLLAAAPHGSLAAVVSRTRPPRRPTR